MVGMFLLYINWSTAAPFIMGSAPPELSSSDGGTYTRTNRIQIKIIKKWTYLSWRQTDAFLRAVVRLLRLMRGVAASLDDDEEQTRDDGDGGGGRHNNPPVFPNHLFSPMGSNLLGKKKWGGQANFTRYVLSCSMGEKENNKSRVNHWLSIDLLTR